MAGDDAPEQDGLGFRDPATARGFTTMPNWVFRLDGPSPGAKLLYGLLLSYAWQEERCWPGQRRLAADLRVAERTIRTWLAELVDARLITVQRRGLNRTNMYWIENWHDQVGAAELSVLERRASRLQKLPKTAAPHEKKTQLRTPRDEPRPLRESYDRFVQQ